MFCHGSGDNRVILSDKVQRGQKRKHSAVSLTSACSSYDKEEDVSYEETELSVQVQIRTLVTCLATAIQDGDKYSMLLTLQSLVESSKQDGNKAFLVSKEALDAVLSLFSLSTAADSSHTEELEKQACLLLSILASKPNHQRQLANGPALLSLVGLLKRKAQLLDTEEPESSHSPSESPSEQPESSPSPSEPPAFEAAGRVARRAAEALIPLLHENAIAQTRFRINGGIPPLISLLRSSNLKAQSAALGCLVCVSRRCEAGQAAMVEAGCLPPVIEMLRRNQLGQALLIALDLIKILAHAIHDNQDNQQMKNQIRLEGGIPPLVNLLDSFDPRVQKSAACCLRVLVRWNEQNKQALVDAGGLAGLMLLLKSEQSDIHSEAVGVIGNLVHSSVNIKRRVLEEGALQPVIQLLSSGCIDARKEAALLLGQFATTDPNYSVRIVQRGAVRPLVDMLGPMHDNQLREMAAFALGRLAQNPDNQAGIVQQGGLKPLLALLDCNNASMQHNAAFAIYGLAENEDNIVDIICEGGVHILMDKGLALEEDRVMKTLKRVEEKLTGKVLRQLLYTLRSVCNPASRNYIATALAHLCSHPKDKALVFADIPTCGPLQVLMSMLLAGTSLERCRSLLGEPRACFQQREGARALHSLLHRAQQSHHHSTTTTTTPPTPPPHPLGEGKETQQAGQHSPVPQIFLGEQYVNNPVLSDVSFIVDGKCFYAHRIALLASSDAFRAMFDGGYKEKEAGQQIDIPNIRHKVFEAMMRCIYTGIVEVTPDIAQELLQAADQYFLETLKALCEDAIAKNLTVDNLEETYEIAETFNAPQLLNRCVLFALEKYDALVTRLQMSGYTTLMRHIEPQLRKYIRQVVQSLPENTSM